MRGASPVAANSAEGWRHRTATCQAEGLSWMSCPQDTPGTCLVGTRQAGAFEEEPAKAHEGLAGWGNTPAGQYNPERSRLKLRMVARVGRAPESHRAEGHAVTLGTS